MKIRSSLLVACMVVVPAVAMFSHRVPAGVRQALRQHVWEPLCRVFTPVLGSADEPASAAHVAVVEPSAGPVVEPGSGPGPGPAEALAGLAVDCRRVDGAEMHVASCRVAIDASGQLHRVFQAAGPTPDEAVAALEQAVAAWQRRLADRAAARPDGL